MPRIDSKKKEYMIRDFAEWVGGRMKSLGLRQEDLAKELGISQQAVSTIIDVKKYKSGKIKDPFTLGNVITLFKILEATEEEKKRFLTL